MDSSFFFYSELQSAVWRPNKNGTIYKVSEHLQSSLFLKINADLQVFSTEYLQFIRF